MGMEKEVQEAQGVTSREEVAQPASVGRATPPAGNRWLWGCTVTQLRSAPRGNPSRPALHLSSLSLNETPRRALQHRGLLTRGDVHLCAPRWGVHLQPDPLSPPPCRPPQLSPPRSWLKPKDQLNSADSRVSIPASVPVESVNPYVAHGTERLNLLQHSRLPNLIFFHIFSPLLGTQSRT